MPCYSHVTRPNMCYERGCYSHVTRPCYSHVIRMLLALLFGLTWKLLACYSPGFGVGDSRSFCQFLLNLLDGLQFSLKIVFQSWKRDLRSQDLAGLGRFLSDFSPFLIFCFFGKISFHFLFFLFLLSDFCEKQWERARISRILAK